MKTMTAAVSVFLLGVILAVSSAGAADQTNAVKPSITITKVPNAPPGDGPMEDISGKVTGVKPKECKVVIYAYGDMWYVQPFANDPYTEIDSDLTWQGQTHGGLEFAALLVKPSFKPGEKLRALPKVGGDILAIAKEKPKKENPKKE